MNQAYDYVIVGGGSAGCVLANRLSADPRNSVCLLEAGGSHKNLLVTLPLGLGAMVPFPIKNWAFNTEPQIDLGNRKGYQPRGRTLGGSSSINAQIYMRGVPQDYDRWASLGNEGWGWNEVLPYFKKAENHVAGADEFHGTGGPLSVSPLRSPAAINKAFIEAGKQCGHPENPDFNGKTQEGVGQFEVTQHNGRRCSSAHAYLSPVAKRPNLTVVKRAHVTKVLFENNRATGVAFISRSKSRRIDAKREVILSAGALQSPQVLMLSGIGAPEELARHGIRVQHNLPGVGKNLQDHIDVCLPYRTGSTEAISFGPIGLARLGVGLIPFLLAKRGVLTSNTSESGGFLYTDRTEPSPDVQMHFSRILLDDHGRNLPFRKGITCHVCMLRPHSRGHVGLNSDDPLAPPLIDPNFLSDERDMQVLERGVRLAQGIMATPAMKKYRGKALFGADSQTDEDVREFIRNRADTIYHPVGTCKMGNDSLSVVDDTLHVRGVQGLRVVDASIMPTLVSGNTNAPVIMIAEKAADMILPG